MLELSFEPERQARVTLLQILITQDNTTSGLSHFVSVDLHGSQMAAARVFCFPELLEMIRENAAPVQLFVVQRVNRTFQAVIIDSKSIRHQMLLESTGIPKLGETRATLRENAVRRALQPFATPSTVRNLSCIYIGLHLPCNGAGIFVIHPASRPWHAPSVNASWRRGRVGHAEGKCMWSALDANTKALLHETTRWDKRSCSGRWRI